MFGIPVRCYQSWAAAHLSTPHYFNLLAFHNKAQMPRHTQTHAHNVVKKPPKPTNTQQATVISFCNHRHNFSSPKENKKKQPKENHKGRKRKKTTKSLRTEASSLLIRNCFPAQLNATNENKLCMPVFFHLIQYQRLSDACV